VRLTAGRWREQGHVVAIVQRRIKGHRLIIAGSSIDHAIGNGQDLGEPGYGRPGRHVNQKRVMPGTTRTLRPMTAQHAVQLYFNFHNNLVSTRLYLAVNCPNRYNDGLFVIINRPDTLINARPTNGFEYHFGSALYPISDLPSTHGLVRVGQQDAENRIDHRGTAGEIIG
jgi:hypothetical protein